jgi:hypothetical protein
MRRSARGGFAREFFFFFGLYFLCGMLIQVYPTPGAWGFTAVSALLTLRVVSLVILRVILPAFNITGGILRDFAKAVTTVYDVTLGPIFRVLAPVVGVGYDLAAQRLHKTHSAHYSEEDGQAFEDASPRFTREEREARSRRRQQERESMRQQAQGQYTCFDVLGIDQAADYETARRAYRELSQQYHPDKVNHLSPEFRQLADQKFKAIASAWGEFKQLHAKLEET